MNFDTVRLLLIRLGYTAIFYVSFFLLGVLMKIEESLEKLIDVMSKVEDMMLSFIFPFFGTLSIILIFILLIYAAFYVLLGGGC